jgi:hypothetical protein
MSSLKAFPHTFNMTIDGQVATCTNYGMDLRDWFAGMAMLSMNLRKDYVDTPANVIAIDSYALADAMIKQREVNNV